jgi:hypothetical protein
MPIHLLGTRMATKVYLLTFLKVRPGKVYWQQETPSYPALPTLCIRGEGFNRKRPGSTHIGQAEGMGRPVHHERRILSYSRLLCSINAQWKGMLVGSAKL